MSTPKFYRQSILTNRRLVEELVFYRTREPDTPEMKPLSQAATSYLQALREVGLLLRAIDYCEDEALQKKIAGSGDAVALKARLDKARTDVNEALGAVGLIDPDSLRELDLAAWLVSRHVFLESI